MGVGPGEPHFLLIGINTLPNTKTPNSSALGPVSQSLLFFFFVFSITLVPLSLGLNTEVATNGPSVALSPLHATMWAYIC